MNRSIPLFYKGKDNFEAERAKEQKLVKVEIPFIDEISGLAIVKILDKLTQSIMMSKLKFYMKFSDVRYNEQ